MRLNLTRTNFTKLRAGLSASLTAIALRICLLSVALAVAGLPVHAEIEDRRWIEVRTDNFRLISQVRETKSVALARDLEFFRLAVGEITNFSMTEESVPTRIYVLRGSWNRFGLEPGAVGLFMPSLRRNLMVVRNTARMSETSTILHEYVHFLVHSHRRLNYPKWFDEGLAEVLSASRVHQGRFETARIPEDSLANLIYSEWIPMWTILSAEGYETWREEKRSMFYAEAWALVHYLFNHPDLGASFVARMAAYIEHVEAGHSDVEAFETAFEMSADELNDPVRRYVRAGEYRYIIFDGAHLLALFEPVVSRLTKAQVSLELGELALRNRALDEAGRLFQVARDYETTRARALAGLGSVHQARGELAEALPLFEEAVRLAPDDPVCRLDLAKYWHARFHADDTNPERETYMKRAERHLVKAWRLDGSAPETYAMMGAMLLEEGRNYDRAIEMLEAAESLLPSDLHVRFLLALAYEATGQRTDAAQAARSVVAWSHSSSAAEQARALLSRLQMAARNADPSRE